ncbi:hypothetical protein AAG570_001231 [Ranatra chinensis]|uniref:SAP30-binding protein n=1 Tax=Ranatra chinensis TaxID=642074 RepID=A0ABD0YBJ4_9HEMI
MEEGGEKNKPKSKSRFASSLVPYHDDTILTEDEDDTEEDSISDTPTEEEPVVEESDEEPKLPPEPVGRCSKDLQDKITRLFNDMRGLDMNSVIQRRKEFRNPSIYEKLIQFCSINEFGTNYPADVYDPTVWGKESFYDELNKAQRADMEQKEKERREKTKVQVIVGTAKKRTGGGGSGPEEEQAPKRKSKWDQVGQTSQSSAQIQPITLLSSALPTKIQRP